ncbi:MAG: nucleotidyltransferase domain-containing protein [Candidatus Njordarchaeota archaeon]
MRQKELDEIVEELRKNGIYDVYISEIIRYISILSDYVDITGILVYGSIVYGKPRIDSDIDIIIVAPDFDCDYVEKIMLSRKIAPKRPARISAVWMGEKEIESAFSGFTGFLLDAIFFGIIVYDKKNILRNLRNRLQKAIKSGKIERKLNMWRISPETGMEEIAL